MIQSPLIYSDPPADSLAANTGRRAVQTALSVTEVTHPCRTGEEETWQAGWGEIPVPVPVPLGSRNASRFPL